MPILTLDGGQSSIALAGQSTTYIVQKILTRMPTVPDTLVNSELQDVLRHFYTMSAGWQEQLGPYFIPAGVAGKQTIIQLNPVDQYKQIQFVRSVWTFPSTNGAAFPGSIQLRGRIPVGNDTGPPIWAFMTKPDQMFLYPAPDKAYGSILYVWAVLLPVVNTPQLPTIAATQHLDALMWGTMARLYMMKGKPWADKQLGPMYQKDYRREILIARDQANRAYSFVDTPYGFPFFAPQRNSGMPTAVRN